MFASNPSNLAASVPATLQSLITMNDVILSGWMTKKPVGKPNMKGGWKKRYFRLTSTSLSYFDKPSAKSAKGVIKIDPSCSVRAHISLFSAQKVTVDQVERVDKNANFELQIKFDGGSKVLFTHCTNATEADTWLQKLSWVIGGEKHEKKRMLCIFIIDISN